MERTYPGKAVESIRHDQGLPQHQQQGRQHSCEEGSAYALLAAVPAGVELTPSPAGTDGNGQLSNHACNHGTASLQCAKLDQAVVAV